MVGIVRRPNPAATDQRFVVVPRSPADIRVLAPASAVLRTALPGQAATLPVTPGAPATVAGVPGSTGPASADVASLAGLAGRSVRVGGLVVAVDSTGLAFDDGTGTARLELAGDARPLLSLLSLGDLGEAVPLAGDDVEAAGAAALETTGAGDVTVAGSPPPALTGGSAVAPMTAGADRSPRSRRPERPSSLFAVAATGARSGFASRDALPSWVLRLAWRRAPFRRAPLRRVPQTSPWRWHHLPRSHGRTRSWVTRHGSCGNPLDAPWRRGLPLREFAPPRICRLRESCTRWLRRTRIAGTGRAPGEGPVDVHRDEREAPGVAEAYCVKCKAKREMKNAQHITMKNGKPAAQGTCPVCGTKMFRIGG